MSIQPAELPQRVVSSIGHQQSLDGLADNLQEALNALYERPGELGQQIEDLLHGTWLGHPLHPILTHIPIGAWTVAEVLDILSTGGRRELEPGADAALLIGVLGALGAAVTGATDWKDTDDAARRIGLVHGMLNVAATALCGASLAARGAGRRPLGRSLSLLGFATVLASGYLGGELVYHRRIGTNHADVPPPRQSFTPVLPESELAEGTMRRVEVRGVAIMLARQGGQIYALADRCAHLGGPLSEGELREGGVCCPWHGSCFALNDGHVIDGPAVYTQPHYDTMIRDGQICVQMPA